MNVEHAHLRLCTLAYYLRTRWLVKRLPSPSENLIPEECLFIVWTAESFFNQTQHTDMSLIDSVLWKLAIFRIKFTGSEFSKITGLFFKLYLLNLFFYSELDMCHYIPCHEFWGGWVAGETGGLYVNHLCVSSSVLVSRFCPKKYFLITFATKFSMVVHCQEPKCHVKRIYCCLQGQVCHVRSASQKKWLIWTVWFKSPDWLVEETWQTMQQRFCFSLFCRRPLWAVHARTRWHVKSCRTVKDSKRW